MTYSRELSAALKKAKARVGDRVKAAGHEGILMPSPELVKDSTHIVLKLDTGYNLGIKFEPKTQIVKLAGRKDAKPGKKPKLTPQSEGKIALLATGGTIASKVDYSTGGVSAALTSEDLIGIVPELGDIAHIDMKTLGEWMSEDLDHENWITIAKECEKRLKKDDGIVITHGTDTMHYTSAILSFMLHTPGKPVVLTGAQRSTDRGSADSAMNLITSAYTALGDIAEVGICMHAQPDDSYSFFIRGTKVRKMHSTMRNAFRPINDYPLAKVFPDGRIEPISVRPYRERGKTETKIVFDNAVELLKVYPGADPKLLTNAVNSGAKGIVIEGTGMGHVPTKARKPWVPVIKDIVSSGVPVVVETQCLYGPVNPRVYSNLRLLYQDAGAIPAADMLPETTYVKLGWVLAQEKKLPKIRDMMLTNYAGEINDRIEPDMFLY